ncbi:alpha/beta hydrolase [Streptomyces sp. NPDC047042]|uniref:alpha/beta hydrolase n=1 Tax=Streptomyces sp. NPDC047042 TaxID=3154807 RepID=UPI0033ED39AE
MSGLAEAVQPFPQPFVPVAYEPPEAVAPHRGPDRTIYPDIMYGHVEGFRPLRLDLYVPDAERAVPVVLYIHGGAWLGGSRKPLHHDFVDFPTIWHQLNRAGMAVASVSYRLASEAPFPTCLHDVKAAVRWLRAHGGQLGLDPGRIGAFGDSAGAHLALLAAQRTPAELEGHVGVTGVPSDLAAVAAWYPPTDLSLFRRPPDLDPQSAAALPETRLLGGRVEELPDLARAASPVTWVHPDSPPVLLVHGTADSLVSIEHSETMAAAYAAAGAFAELQVVSRADHCFLGIDIEPIAERTVTFLRRHLQA